MNIAISSVTNKVFGLAPSFGWNKTEHFVVNAKFKREQNVNLSTKGLNVSVKGAKILKDVNVEIPQHKITCIIGPSGCGKSTLLRTFNRLNDGVEGMKISGEVILGEHNILKASSSELTQLRRNIGLVPQRPCPLPMSIYDNVAYGCRIHGIRGRKKLDAVVKHYLQQVGLWDEVKDRLHSPANRLSGGQQQRLCLARSLAVEPSYLLADESTSALDPISSKKVESLFTELKKDYSIVMVTHTLRQALRLADYVVFMYLGEVIEAGPAEQVFHHPKNELTKKYLEGAFS
ncbi:MULTISPECIES: phosphate ABC transporter ATP-binding protein [Segatella]|jgi:phosphate transport system ATP-binding protein|nr:MULTISPECIES: phosphate ABC transporter ATP-binding protein [Segatella]MBQ3858858.1 phosphate ABC transporter ATP-binding protein [Prevotella sp.]MDR4931673.1 phosphate ABC transporter ATP-binding protein [Segatella bryantii]OYP53836.1 phosphate ABC transporter ATP-binding protein [Segatella bryantii]UKK74783.1 phosphate ABC transporter ATP-binding protein [Segatella bryantii]UKK79818.1 phosphate ABC transporter ATP-binding protein [Segatella baroniae B14]